MPLMRRQTDPTITSRVYSYGCVPQRISPALNENLAIIQTRLGNELWNALVAIEHGRVEQYHEIMRDERQDRVSVLKVEIAAIKQEIRDRRKAVRSKAKADISDILPRMNSATTEMGVLLEILSATKVERHAARASALDENNERAERRVVEARQAAASTGLFWGTYNDIIQRFDTARKRKGCELQFHKFRDEGTVTAQIQGGIKINETHTFFQLDATTPGQKWQDARVRIGSNGREPIYLSVPIVYHRPIPDEATIKSVSATRRIVAGRASWQLNVTCNIAKPEPKANKLACALDIGFRLKPDGIRLGYWRDENGKHGEFLMPEYDVRQYDKIKATRSRIDRERDEFLPGFAVWVNAEPRPEEWAARAAFLSQWRSTARIARLIRFWADNRLPNDAEMFTAALAWRKHILHLANLRSNLEDQMRARARERGRIFGAEFAQTYGRVFIEEFDLRQIAEKKDPGTKHRQIASPSVFRAAVVNACRREGVELVKLPAAFTTRQCHVCGGMEEWDQAASIFHRCGSCGGWWDQDHNAAINLLRAGLGTPASAPAPVEVLV